MSHRDLAPKSHHRHLPNSTTLDYHQQMLFELQDDLEFIAQDDNSTPLRQVKDEPDLTISLQTWMPSSPSQQQQLNDRNVVTTTTQSTTTTFASGPAAATSAYLPGLPPMTPEPHTSPPVSWQEFSYPYDDTLPQDTYYDMPGTLYNNANSSIPWEQWTQFEMDHVDMPQTPVDPLPAAFGVNPHTYSNDRGFVDSTLPIGSQTMAQKVDLLSPFTSMALESPPLANRNCLAPMTSYSSTPETAPVEALFFDPAVSQYDASPPMGISSGVSEVPRQPFEVKHEVNLIPTLSSSLPASLASPPAKSPRRNSPTHGTRVRTRASSDASDKPYQPHPLRHGTRKRREKEEAAIDPLKPPKQSLSTWQIFFTDWIAKQEASGGRKLNVAQAAKEAGKEYKAMSKEAKEPYARRAALARAGRQQALTEWHSTLTPSLIALENRYRSSQRKLGLSRRSNLKDPNAPKKPLSAYFMFLRAVRENEEWSERVFEGEKETTRQSVMAAAKWRDMSDAEKRPFLAQAEQEKLEYEAARKEYEDSFERDSSSPGDSPDQSGSSRRRCNSTGSTAMAFRLDDIGPPLATSAPTSSMGYFSSSLTSTSGTIPIHIPRMPRSDSYPPSPPTSTPFLGGSP